MGMGVFMGWRRAFSPADLGRTVIRLQPLREGNFYWVAQAVQPCGSWAYGDPASAAEGMGIFIGWPRAFSPADLGLIMIRLQPLREWEFSLGGAGRSALQTLGLTMIRLQP